MSGGNTMNYITGGLETIAGAAATYFGAPQIGVPLMTSGVNQLAGGGKGSGGGIGGAGNMLSQFLPGTPGAAVNAAAPSPTSAANAGASAAPGGGLQQALGGLNQMAPSLQAIMKALGAGQQQQQQPPPPLPSPPPPNQFALTPNPPPITPAGQMSAQGNPVQQILAMLGRGG